MAVIELITILEADTFLATYAEWLLLTDAVKHEHIYTASLYMQSRWSCALVDWEDATTLTDEQKRACAYYAEASRLGVLFPTVEERDRKGYKTEETIKLGTLVETTRWREFGVDASTNPLASIDALMALACDRASSADLVRV